MDPIATERVALDTTQDRDVRIESARALFDHFPHHVTTQKRLYRLQRIARMRFSCAYAGHPRTVNPGEKCPHCRRIVK